MTRSRKQDNPMAEVLALMADQLRRGTSGLHVERREG